MEFQVASNNQLREVKEPISQQKWDTELHLAICLKEHQPISWLDEAKTL